MDLPMDAFPSDGVRQRPSWQPMPFGAPSTLSPLSTVIRFMRTFKEEEVDGKTYRSIDEARTHIGAFLENVYNQGRLHPPARLPTPGCFRSRTPPTRNRLKANNQGSVTQILCLSRGVQLSRSHLLFPKTCFPCPWRRATLD